MLTSGQVIFPLSEMHMSASGLASRLPLAAGWFAFYGAVAAAWAGLILLAGEFPTFGGFIARCLETVAMLDFFHLFAMWALMALAMMLPTALPMLRRLAEILQGRVHAAVHFAAFCAGYVVIWLGFALAAALAQMALADRMMLDAAGRLQDGFVAALLLAIAGLYQFSTLKHACLSRCRHPMTFFMAYWRPGARGAFAMGLRHGGDCLGCCWPLMLLAFVGGTMNIAWMALATFLMLIEKLAGAGRYVTAPLGIVLVLAAGFAFGLGLQEI